MKIIKKPEEVISCSWQITNLGDGRYWAGGCEGDKESHDLAVGVPLKFTCDPNHFAMGAKIQQIENVCPDCQVPAHYSSVHKVWYCKNESCGEESYVIGVDWDKEK
jgi:hypothetical protein